jgi:drug/metabolite transporter (DMT)-like permease
MADGRQREADGHPVAPAAGRADGGGAAGRVQCRPGAGWPITEVLLVAVCYAIGPLIANRKLSRLPPVGMTAACLAFAAIVYAPLAALTWTSAQRSAKVLAAVAGLAVICAAVAFLPIFRLIAEVGPARASVITYINPAVAVAIGVSVLWERLTAAMLEAFVLILGGSVLATRPGQHSRPSPGAEPAVAGLLPGTAGRAAVASGQAQVCPTSQS